LRAGCDDHATVFGPESRLRAEPDAVAIVADSLEQSRSESCVDFHTGEIHHFM